MTAGKYNENEINLMKHAYSMGISKGMETYMSWLPEKRKHVTYIPNTQDNTYIVKTAYSLSDAYPRPMGPLFIRRRDYDTITLLLLEFAAKNLHKFSLDKTQELEVACKAELGECTRGELIHKMCEEIENSAKDDFRNRVDSLEKDDDKRTKESLSEFAKKNHLVEQELFYVSKFQEYLDKNPGVSEIYANLDTDQKKSYTEDCYTALYFKTNGASRLPIKEVFEKMVESPETFIEIDKDFKEYETAHKESETNEEDYEMDL